MKIKKSNSEDNVTAKEVKWTKASESYDMEALYEIENNDELIRLEMNTIEFPLFTKNKRIKENLILTYEFNYKKNQYLKVTPLADNRIPGEFEEKIFFAIMKLYKKNGHNQTVYTDFYTLISEMGITYTGNSLGKVKKGLKALSTTNYEFNNLFYSNEIGGILNDNIITNMFTIRRINFKEAQVIENEEFLDSFRNRKIKEIIQIKFTGHFYENIIRRGYLYFDRQNLLQIENSTSRTIYIMLTKWRNSELYIKRYSKFLASRIPLSWKKSNVPRTVKILNAAFEDLKNKELIQNYKFNSDNGYDTSYFEVWFEEKHNKRYHNKVKNIIHDDLEITDEIKENMILMLPDKSSEDNYPVYEQTLTKQARELYERLPEAAKDLKTLRKRFEKYLKKYDYEYLKGAIDYTSKNAKKSYGKYLDECINNYWHEGFVSDKQKLVLTKEKNKTIGYTSEEKEELIKGMATLKKSFEDLKESNPKLAEQIESEVLSEYLVSINKTALSKNENQIFNFTKWNSIGKKMNQYKEVEIKKEIIVSQKNINKTNLSRKEISEFLNKTAQKLALLYGMEEIEELELKMKVAEKIIEHEENITLKIIQDTFDKLLKSKV